MSRPYFLLTENTFHASYLVTTWLKDFGGDMGFTAVVLRDDPLPSRLSADRAAFHHDHAGQTTLDAESWRELERLYPDLSATERAMLCDFGMPEYTVDEHSKTVFLGRDLNSDNSKDWLTGECGAAPYVFVFLDKILAPWWIDLTESRIVNVHSAVLPHARGTFAIEQAAIIGDRELFRHAAGATAHVVDNGVDTGPILRAEGFADPFAFETIWSCKGHSFMLAFDVLKRVAHELIDESTTLVVPVVPAPSPFDAPEFKRADFTAARQAESEAAYLAMRAAAPAR